MYRPSKYRRWEGGGIGREAVVGGRTMFNIVGAATYKYNHGSGGFAGGLEILCTFPTEYVKTQLQLDSRLGNI